jgi:hypothetical protein
MKRLVDLSLEERALYLRGYRAGYAAKQRGAAPPEAAMQPVVQQEKAPLPPCPVKLPSAGVTEDDEVLDESWISRGRNRVMSNKL